MKEDGLEVTNLPFSPGGGGGGHGSRTPIVLFLFSFSLYTRGADDLRGSIKTDVDDDKNEGVEEDTLGTSGGLFGLTITPCWFFSSVL